MTESSVRLLNRENRGGKVKKTLSKRIRKLSQMTDFQALLFQRGFDIPQDLSHPYSR